MQVDNRASEMQANAIARASSLIVLGDIESLEDVAQILFLYANTIVLDHYLRKLLSIGLLYRLDRQDDVTTIRCVFECIGQQIHDNLIEIVGVDPYEQFRGIVDERERDILFDSNDIEVRAQVFENNNDICIAETEMETAIVDFTHIEQLVDKVGQHLRVAIHGAVGILTLGVIVGRHQFLERADDERERSLDFVRDIGEETQLCLIDLDGTLVALIAFLGKIEDTHMIDEISHDDDQEQYIEEDCPSRHPPIRTHHDLDLLHI